MSWVKLATSASIALLSLVALPTLKYTLSAARVLRYGISGQAEGEDELGEIDQIL